MQHIKSDSQVKQDVEAELRWDPKVNDAQIGVTVDGGAVALNGTVDTYAEKFAAEDAIKRVSGVRSVALDISVKVLDGHKRTDFEIAQAMQTALGWDVYVPDTVTATVKNGAVTLAGSAAGNYQRDAAERAVRYLTGVTSVFNGITLKPTAIPSGVLIGQVKDTIEAALKRQATKDANSIVIEAKDGTVTLTGRASSWRSISDAAAAAWSAPGVIKVVDEMHVGV